jgi:hypothetical protein
MMLVFEVRAAQKVSQVAPVTLTEWAVPFIIASAILLMMDSFKMVKARKKRRVDDATL